MERHPGHGRGRSDSARLTKPQYSRDEKGKPQANRCLPAPPAPHPPPPAGGPRRDDGDRRRTRVPDGSMDRNGDATAKDAGPARSALRVARARDAGTRDAQPRFAIGTAPAPRPSRERLAGGRVDHGGPLPRRGLPDGGVLRQDLRRPAFPAAGGRAAVSGDAVTVVAVLAGIARPVAAARQRAVRPAGSTPAVIIAGAQVALLAGILAPVPAARRDEAARERASRGARPLALLVKQPLHDAVAAPSALVQAFRGAAVHVTPVSVVALLARVQPSVAANGKCAGEDERLPAEAVRARSQRTVRAHLASMVGTGTPDAATERTLRVRRAAACAAGAILAAAAVRVLAAGVGGGGEGGRCRRRCRRAQAVDAGAERAVRRDPAPLGLLL